MYFQKVLIGNFEWVDKQSLGPVHFEHLSVSVLWTIPLREVFNCQVLIGDFKGEGLQQLSAVSL